MNKLNLLFVCTVNKMRSITAEKIYETDPRFVVKSAGTDPYATVPINQALLEWADVILVMERMHRNKIRKLFPALYHQKRIICLYIPDDYEFMQPELIGVIKHQFEQVYRTQIQKEY